MGERLKTWWAGVQQSLWFVPSVLAVLAVLLAAVTVRVDTVLLANGRPDLFLAFGGGVDGAREVLGSIAGTMITVTGVVFSVTIVALQLASSQFSPRVLRGFTADRANQVVLGVFIGTFLYALLVLRTVRSASDDGQLFVPSLSVGVAIVLALVSIGFLIFYIHHAARTIQASVIIDRATADTRKLVARLFPEPIGEAADIDLAIPLANPVRVTADRAGYLQALDADRLFNLADRGGFILRMEAGIGEFILPGSLLASYWGDAILEDDAVAAVLQAFLLGLERTPQHDVEFGLRQLTDIAVRALSPGINDPVTAIICVDRLAEVLVMLGNRATPNLVRRGGDGQVRFIARETTFDRAVDVSFDQIRHYGVGDPVVAMHLLETLGRLATLVPPHRRAPLTRQAQAVLRSARRLIAEPLDLARLDQCGQAILNGAATPGSPSNPPST